MGGTSAQTRSERVLEQPNEPPLTEGHTSGSGDGRMEHTFELTNTVPLTPNDSPLTGGYTHESDEGRLKLEELMDLCTTLSNRVSTLENELSSTKAVYHKAFSTLTKKDSTKQGRMIEELDKDEDINLDSEIEKEVMNRSGFHLQQESSQKQKLDQQTEKKEEEVEAQADSDQEVTDMTKVDKIEAKRTKPGMGMNIVQEIETKGEFISNIIPLILYPK
nr:hypothetical protein [Tanacetum cinerariifolium]